MEHSLDTIKSSRFIVWGLVIAIVVILNLFFVFSVRLVYTEPKFEDFCKQEQVHVVPQTQNECVAVGGQWVEDRFLQKGFPQTERLEPAPITEVQKGYCNENYTCGQEFDTARQLYERNFFIALVVLGTLTLVASFVFRNLDVVATALSFGGVLTLIVASVRYWSNMNDYLRVIVLGIALGALIWIGVKKFRK